MKYKRNRFFGGLLTLAMACAVRVEPASGDEPKRNTTPRDSSARDRPPEVQPFIRGKIDAQIRYGVFSPDNKALAICPGEAKVEIYDSATARQLVVVDAINTIRVFPDRLSYAPDGRVIAAAGSNQEVVGLFDTITGKLRQRLDYGTVNSNPTCWVLDLAYAPDGATVAAGLSTGEVILWDAASGRRIAVIPPHIVPIGHYPYERTGRPMPAEVRQVAFAPDGKTLWVFATGAPPRAWDVATGAERPFPVPGSIWTRAAFSVDGRLVALCDRLGMPEQPKPGEEPDPKAFNRRIDKPYRWHYRLYDATTWEQRSEATFEAQIIEMVVLPHGRSVVTWEDPQYSNVLRLRDASDGRVLASCPWPTRAGGLSRFPQFLAVAPDGRRVAFGGTTTYGPGIVFMYEVDGTTLRLVPPAP